MPKKNNSTYKTISEVLEILNSNVDTQKKIELHTIRFWETQFKQLNPKRINKKVALPIFNFYRRSRAKNS